MNRLLIALGGLTVGMTIGTQWVAHDVAPTAALKPALRLGSSPVYWPWSIVSWWRPYAHEYPAVFGQASMFVMGSVAATTVGMMLVRGRTVASFGDQHWASIRDARRAGLLTGRGVPLGYLHGRVVSYPADQEGHVLVIAAARGGKTRSVVLGTLLTTPKCCLINDPKGELYEKTAGHRARLGRVLALDPTRDITACWNPLAEVRPTHDVQDCQQIAHALIDQGATTDPIWPTRAIELTTAILLHVLYTEDSGRKHLGRVRELIQCLDSTIEAMLTTPHCVGVAGPQLHPEVERVALDLRCQVDKFRESIKATALSALPLWADPRVVQATSKSTFGLADLMCSEPVSLYVQCPASDTLRLRPFSRLFLDMCFTRFLEHLHRVGDRPKRHKLLFVGDEITLIGGGAWEAFPAYLRLSAGYGIQALVVSQAFADLGAFGRNQSLPDTVAVLSVFGVSDPDTLQRVSTAVGQTTEYRRSFSRKGRLSPLPSSLSDSEQMRPVLDTGAMRALDECVVLVNGVKPLRLTKINCYRDRGFRARMVAPPPFEEAVGEDLPHPWDSQHPKGPRLSLPGDDDAARAELSGLESERRYMLDMEV